MTLYEKCGKLLASFAVRFSLYLIIPWSFIVIIKNLNCSIDTTVKMYFVSVNHHAFKLPQDSQRKKWKLEKI